MSERDNSLGGKLRHITPDFVDEQARRVTRDQLAGLLLRAGELEQRFREAPLLEPYHERVTRWLSLLDAFESGRGHQPSLWAAGVMAFALGYVIDGDELIPDSQALIGHLDDAEVLRASSALLARHGADPMGHGDS